MSEGPPTSRPAETGQPEVPAGWYPHPTAPGWEAYWTGTGWGAETRPAPGPAPAAPTVEQQAATPTAEAQGGAQEAAAQGATERPAAAQRPAPEEPAGGRVAPEAAAAATAAPEAAAASAAAEAPAAAAAETPAPAAATPAPAAAQTPEAATATPAAAASGRGGEGSSSALPMLLCVLGAVVAAVGAFLPAAKLDFGGTSIDLVDNTMVAAGYGIAVIAAAALGAAIAIWSYVKGAASWLPILLGVVILAIAVYAGTAGLDVTPDFGTLGAGQPLDTDAADPSTGIFAAGAGGLLMILGGLGLARSGR
ncbi:MAG: hypothetical protein KJ006_09650 [Thermoleophilia bacterium]|nr:hypothetical protein [Thermoleophilia bacterium]